MKYNKILAGVLTVSIICCLLITYTGSSSGTPPTEEELLSRWRGLIVRSNKEVVYPDEEEMWRYQLYLFSGYHSGVSIQKIEIWYYDFNKEYRFKETIDSHRLEEYWGSAYIPIGEKKDFGMGFPSRNQVYYLDYIVTGVNDWGREVSGACRIYFSKEPAPPPPIEEELLSWSHGLRFEREQRVVYPDDENAWRYALHIYPECSGWVRLERMEVKALTFSDEYIISWVYGRDDFDQWWSNAYIPSGQKRGFILGVSSKSQIYYRDHILTGVNEAGEEVKATCRVYFSKEKAPTP